MASSSIVRVGASDESFGQQLTAALGQFLFQSDDTNNDNIQQQQQQESTITHLSISNKYFDAKVALCPLSIVVDGAEDTTTGKQEDGIVLVFDDSSKAAFDVLGGLHGNAEANDENGDLLRLCVGVKNHTNPNNTNTKAYEEEYSRRVLWCLDHGYEFVESVDLSETGLHTGHDAREKEGFARVVEALQGTVWSSAIMHTKQKQQLKQSYQETREQQQEPQQQQQQQQDNNQYEPPTSLPSLSIISDEESKEREEKARDTLLQQDGMIKDEKDEEAKHNNNNNNYDSNYLDGKAPVVLKKEDKAEEQKADQIMSQMESVLSEANRIRHMSQAGALSDDDRKKRAGDAALCLMNLMNQMGDDDESDDDNDNDNDDNNGSGNE